MAWVTSSLAAVQPTIDNQPTVAQGDLRRIDGQTIAAAADGDARRALVLLENIPCEIGSDVELYIKYEGLNPTGSFKDRGMTAAISEAAGRGAKAVICASTGNTSASLAMYCAVTRLMKAVIFIGSGKISYGKLSQALDFGALTVQITGDFDDAMEDFQ